MRDSSHQEDQGHGASAIDSRAGGSTYTTDVPPNTPSSPGQGDSQKGRSKNSKERKKLKEKIQALEIALEERNGQFTKWLLEYSQEKSIWEEDKRELQHLQKSAEMFKKLQEEVLASVDRHEPTFDEKIHAQFIQINGKINTAIRSPGKNLSLFKMFASTPFDGWTEDALPSYCYNSSSPLVSVEDKTVVKLLMRLAIWNFIDRTLFDRGNPFAVYASSPARSLSDDYRGMFGDDYETSETAAKWRAITARRLAELDNKEYQDEVFNDLIKRFSLLVHDAVGYQEKSSEEIEKLFQGDMLQKLEPVFRSAIDLARLVSQERAGYTLLIPDLRKFKFEKIDDDGYLTNRARLPNIDVACIDEEVAGRIALVASPMLIKWGTGGGEQLTHKTVLEKAFVQVEPYVD
ncbi:Fc.00g028370.m01.CDS01 [Cosmosporella sp. VM-42]